MKVNGRRWALDPQCLIPTPGEQPEDEEGEGKLCVYTGVGARALKKGCCMSNPGVFCQYGVPHTQSISL